MLEPASGSDPKPIRIFKIGNLEDLAFCTSFSAFTKVNVASSKREKTTLGHQSGSNREPD